jgi:hypothetical protein
MQLSVFNLKTFNFIYSVKTIIWIQINMLIVILNTLICCIYIFKVGYIAIFFHAILFESPILISNLFSFFFMNLIILRLIGNRIAIQCKCIFFYDLNYIFLMLLSFVLELFDREMNIFLSDFWIKHGDWSMHIDCGRLAYIECFFYFAFISFSLCRISTHCLFHFNFHFYLLTLFLYLLVLLCLGKFKRFIRSKNFILILTNFLDI